VNHDALEAGLVAGAVIAGALAGATLVQRASTPRFTARLLSVLCVLSAAALSWVLFLVASANIVQVHGVAERLPLCGEILARHRDVPTPIGAGVIALLGSAAVGAFRARRVQRRLRALPGGAPVEIVASDRPAAFSLPGRPGQIVVTTAMLAALEAPEREALFAHERAHLQHAHHRYVRVVELCGAAFPVLRPLGRRVRFAVERWADEVAATAIGDRAVVARALAKAAMIDTTASGTLAMSDSGVVERVEALLCQSPARPAIARPWAAVTLAVVSGGLLVWAVTLHTWLSGLLGLCTR